MKLVEINLSEKVRAPRSCSSCRRGWAYEEEVHVNVHGDVTVTSPEVFRERAGEELRRKKAAAEANRTDRVLCPFCGHFADFCGEKFPDGYRAFLLERVRSVESGAGTCLVLGLLPAAAVAAAVGAGWLELGRSVWGWVAVGVAAAVALGGLLTCRSTRRCQRLLPEVESLLESKSEEELEKFVLECCREDEGRLDPGSVTYQVKLFHKVEKGEPL